MSLMTYTAILDNGRRCQSCCNRAQIFGLRDIVTGWEGDCSECNIRWNRRQVAAVCRTMSTNMKHGSFSGAGLRTSGIIFAFANLDAKLHRRKCLYKHRINMCKTMLTTAIDSDDEYFESNGHALTVYPLTLLDDMSLRGETLRCDAVQFVNSDSSSVLDLVATFICPRP